MLTPRKIESIKPEAQRLEIKDDPYPLLLVVQPSGVKSFQCRVRVGGKQQRKVLGRWPLISLADARKAALDIKNTVTQGITPVPLVKPQTGPDTTHCFILFMEMEGGKAKTASERWRMWEKDIKPNIGTKPIETVTRTDLSDIVAAKYATGPTQSNRVRGLLCRFFNWSVKEGWSITKLEANPMALVSRMHREKPRDRPLSEQELKWFFQSVNRAGAFAGVFEALLRTITRRSEMFELQWFEVLEDRIAISPKDGAGNAKNGTPNVIWLHPTVEALMGSRGDPRNKVFGVAKVGYSKPVERLNKALAQCAVKAGINEPWVDFNIHDFRATAVSLMGDWIDEYTEEPLVTPFILDRLLNHKDISVRGRHYSKNEWFPQKRSALRLWNDYLDRIKSQALSEAKTHNIVLSSPSNRRLS